MNTKRLDKIMGNLSREGLTQMIVCDPATIYYLTGNHIHSGERMLVLYLRADGKHKLFINKLFNLSDDAGVEPVWFSDCDDSVALLVAHTDHTSPIGVDKDWRAQFLLHFMEMGGATACINASPCADLARSCKDTHEQALMREASRINDECMGEFITLIHDGVSEQEVAKQIPAIYRAHGADGVSFDPIVGFGANAADAHHEPDSTTLKVGDCVMFDVGCIKDGYCSDMTRTFFYGKASAAHMAIHELVRKANETAEAIIRPGVPMCDIDKAARDVITLAGYGDNFVHRLGHSIGFECHEAGDVSAVNPTPAQVGMVFSVEPGVYCKDDVGVRIEDLVLVTESGCEILNHYPKTFAVLPQQA